MIFRNQIKKPLEGEIERLGLKSKREEVRVGIIGLGFMTLLVAEKLSQMGIQVTIVDRYSSC